MKKRGLGKTGMEITPLGVGAWAIGGGGYAFGWGPQDDAESIAAIRAAVDAGINWIDTAPIYGLGHSEETIARALDGFSPRPYVFTKCGIVWNERREIERRIKKDSIRQEIEGSLRRLRVDAIDLYQIHWPQPDDDIEEAWTALVEIKREGKARHIGVSNFSASQMERIQSISPIETLQPPYSLLAREVEESALPWAMSHGAGVISYSPMKSGLLSGAMTRERIANLPQDDFRHSAVEFREPRLSRNLALVEVLREIGKAHGCPPGAVAIAWVLKNPGVTGAIVGMRSARQVAEIAGAAELTLTAQEIARIEDALADTRPGLFDQAIGKAKGLARRVLGR